MVFIKIIKAWKRVWDGYDKYGSSYNKYIINIKKYMDKKWFIKTLNIKELNLESNFYILNGEYVFLFTKNKHFNFNNISFLEYINVL